jgi:hypothetical protein
MTTEQVETVEGADVGAQTDQTQAQSPAPAQPAAGALSFSAEQQAHIDRMVGERLKRAQEKWQADLEAKNEAERKAGEAKRLKDEQKWQELAQAQEVKATEAEASLAKAREQLARANKVIEGLVESRKKGLPEAMLKTLDGRDIYDQLELANAFIESLPAQPANGSATQRQAVTTPTPEAQGNRALTPEERRQQARRIW